MISAYAVHARTKPNYSVGSQRKSESALSQLWESKLADLGWVHCIAPPSYFRWYGFRKSQLSLHSHSLQRLREYSTVQCICTGNCGCVRSQARRATTGTASPSTTKGTKWLTHKTLWRHKMRNFRPHRSHLLLNTYRGT